MDKDRVIALGTAGILAGTIAIIFSTRTGTAATVLTWFFAGTAIAAFVALPGFAWYRQGLSWLWSGVRSRLRPRGLRRRRDRAQLVAAARWRFTSDGLEVPQARKNIDQASYVGPASEGSKRYAVEEQSDRNRGPEPQAQGICTAEEAGWIRPVLRKMEADLRKALASLEKAEADDKRFRVVWGSRLVFPPSVGEVGVPSGRIWQEHRQHLARLEGRLDLYDSLQAAYSLIARLHRLISQHRYLPLGKREFAEAFTVLRNAEAAVRKELDELG